MSTVASSSSSLIVNTVTDIAQTTRHLVNTLNGHYPLRRAEIELFPTTFCQQLIEEAAQSSNRHKAPATMPRSLFDSLLEAAAQCVGGDTSSSTLTFGGLALNDFQLDRAYPFCLFQNGKVVVPHDTVFLVLHHLRAHCISHQLDLKPLVYDKCTFITTKVVNRFLRIMTEPPAATPSAAPQPTTAAPPIRMSTFGINISTATSFIRQTTGLHSDKLPTSHQSSTVSHQNPLPPDSDSVITARSKTLEPSTPRASRFRAPTISSALPPFSPAAYDDSVHSPRSPSLTKRLFQDELTSIRREKRSRVLQDLNQERQSGKMVAESSKAGYASDRRRQRANRSNQERAQVQSDNVPETSPISKLMPGSFYSRGERVEGGRRKRTVRDKENVSLKKGFSR